MPRSHSGVFGTTDQPIRARLATLAASALLVLSLGSCGGDGGSGSYTIGGSVSGLPKGAQLQLDLAFTDAVTGAQSGGSTNIVANGPFTFPFQVNSGDTYDVYWMPNAPSPSGYTCSVGHASGIAMSNVTTVAVTCSAIRTVTFDVTVSGLTAGAQMVIGDDASNSTVTVAANGETTLQEPRVLPSSYYIHVVSQPIGLSCISTNNSGTVTSTAPVNVGVTCSPITEYLYALGCVGSASFEQLEQFGVGADGLPTPLNAPLIQINPGACPAAVASVTADATGHYLYVTGGGGLLSQFSIGLGGVLTPLSPATVATGNVPQAVITDPVGQFSYVANMADNTVSQYAIGATGALTPLSVPTVPTGNTPTAIAIDPKGRYVYVLNSMDNTLSQYDLGSGGALTEFDTLPGNGGDAFNLIVVDPTGHFAYQSNGIVLSEYALGPAGVLTPVTENASSTRQSASDKIIGVTRLGCHRPATGHGCLLFLKSARSLIRRCAYVLL